MAPISGVGFWSVCEGSTYKKKKEHTQLCTILPHRQTRKEKLSRYWSETSAAEVHTYIFQLFPEIVAELIHSTSW